MHLHGFYYHVDGTGDAERYKSYNEAESPQTRFVDTGQTFDMTWLPGRPVGGYFTAICWFICRLRNGKCLWGSRNKVRLRQLPMNIPIRQRRSTWAWEAWYSALQCWAEAKTRSRQLGMLNGNYNSPSMNAAAASGQPTPSNCETSPPSLRRHCRNRRLRN
jgi:hypothetical protein